MSLMSRLRLRYDRAVRRIQRTLVRPSDVWTRSISHEMEFWEEWLSTRGMTWPDDYDRRIDPQTPLDEQLIIAQLPHVAEPVVKILDVGSGPLTVLGKRYPGKTLEITAADALGDQFNTLLDRLGIIPPVGAIACHGEQLLSKFSPNTFDSAYARNALDHAYDPVSRDRKHARRGQAAPIRRAPALARRRQGAAVSRPAPVGLSYRRR